MRKCRSCGYLLLGEGETCGRCGAPLAVVTAGAPAAATSTPSAPAPAAPAPAASWPPVAAPASAPATPPATPSWTPPSSPAPAGEPLPALRESWQPVAIAAPVPQPKSKKLGLTILAVVIVLVVGAGVMHMRSNPIPKGTAAFVAGNGKIYNSPDGVYQAQFPEQPKYEQQATGGGMLARAYNSNDDYEIIAVSIAATVAVPAGSVNTLLQRGLDEEMTNLGAKLSDSDLTTFAGHPAIEGRFKGKDGYTGRILAVASGSHIFEVVVHAKSGTEKLFKAFEDSLIVS